MTSLLRAIFGCSHEHISWPMTIKGETTVQCHDCCRRVSYDWTWMETVSDRRSSEAREEQHA